MAINRWLHKHTVSKRPDPRVRELPWRILKSNLIELGCDIKLVRGNTYKITRQVQAEAGFMKKLSRSRKIKISQDGMNIDKGLIATIRAELHLDVDHGISNSVFYSRNPILPSEFIQKYAGLIKRLARF